MTDSPGSTAGRDGDADISAKDLDGEGNDEVTATSDPTSYSDDEGTLGGLGGAESTSGGAG